MTGTLVKFEFRSSFRQLLVIWAALLAMTILMCIMLTVSVLPSYESMVQSRVALDLISSIVHGISWVLYVALFASLVILTVAVVIARFYRGLLREEGYLMHTLPVKTWQLITAKGITATCAVIGSTLVGMLSIGLIASVGDVGVILGFFRDAGKAIAQEPAIILIMAEGFILAILGILKSVYQIYASMAIGQLANRRRVLISLGAYIGIDVALSTLAGIIVFLGSMTGMWEHLRSWFEANADVFKWGLDAPSQIFMLLLFLAQAVQLMGFHIITERLLATRLNLL